MPAEAKTGGSAAGIQGRTYIDPSSGRWWRQLVGGGGSARTGPSNRRPAADYGHF